MYRTIEYIISKEEQGISIENFLRNKLYSSKLITKLKKNSAYVILNNKESYMNTILSTNDYLKININEDKSSENVIPKKLKLDIIYEDDDIIVINKDKNMPIHPSLNNYDNSLANALAYYFKIKNRDFIFRCINRLDKDTSGLTLIAKNILSADILYKNMLNRKIKRTYIAIVKFSKNLKSIDKIDLPIARENASLIKRKVDFKNGKRAITNYKILDIFDDKALLELKLDTGRTHQIRVHLSFLDSPLIGDYIYNEEYYNNKTTRPLLHSYKLSFKHPIYNKELTFIAPLPKDMFFRENTNNILNNPTI